MQVQCFFASFIVRMRFDASCAVLAEAIIFVLSRISFVSQYGHCLVFWSNLANKYRPHL